MKWITGEHVNVDVLLYGSFRRLRPPEERPLSTVTP